jgi:hypothetical protein
MYFCIMDTIITQTYTCTKEIITTTEPVDIVGGLRDVYMDFGTIEDIAVSANLNPISSWDRRYGLTMVIEVQQQDLTRFAQVMMEDWETTPGLPKVNPIVL